MKSKILLLVHVLIFAILIYGCNKSSNSNNEYLVFNVGNSHYVCDTPFIGYYDQYQDSSVNYTGISGKTTSFGDFYGSFSGHTIGTYPFLIVGEIDYAIGRYYRPCQATVNITEYGAIGEHISAQYMTASQIVIKH